MYYYELTTKPIYGTEGDTSLRTIYMKTDFAIRTKKTAQVFLLGKGYADEVVSIRAIGLIWLAWKRFTDKDALYISI